MMHTNMVSTTKTMMVLLGPLSVLVDAAGAAVLDALLAGVVVDSVPRESTVGVRVFEVPFSLLLAAVVLAAAPLVPTETVFPSLCGVG